MTQDASIPDGELTEDSDARSLSDDTAGESALEHLSQVHAERLKDIQTDRWRMGERIEALESQNAELQASFLEQTRTLGKELTEARAHHAQELKGRLADATAARAAEDARLETLRQDFARERQRLEAHAERLLSEALAAKDLALQQVRDHQQEANRQQQLLLEELTQLRRELQAELTAARAQAQASAFEAQRAKDETLALAEARTQLVQELSDRHTLALRELEERANQRVAAAARPDLERELVAMTQELSAARRDRDELAARLAVAPALDTPVTDAELAQLRQTVQSVRNESANYRRAVTDLESKLDKAKDTLSFRLGYLLIHAPKSWSSLKRLPIELLQLKREASRRRDAKRGSTSVARSGSASAPKLAEAAMSCFALEGHEAAARLIEASDRHDHERSDAFTRLAKALRTSEPRAALQLAQRAYDLEPQPSRGKWLAFLRYEQGEVEAPARILRSLPQDHALKASEKSRMAEIFGAARLRAKLPQVPAPAALAFKPTKGTQLYVAASALPFHVSGYTVRTHSLVRALQHAGCQMTTALRPGYPADRGIDLPGSETSHAVEDVTYLTVPGPHLRRLGLDEFVEAAAAALVDVAMRVRPELIHAASNHVNALPALIAARRLGLPFVYEVRGQWELTSATRHQDWEQSERFALERALETLVAQSADHVMTLTEQLAADFEGRGVPRHRLTVIPNSVDPALFAPRKKDPEALLRFGVTASTFTLVYAGSLLHYEGLDDLLRAVAALLASGVDTTLLIAGDGEATESLERLRRELNVERRVKLVGRLSPADVPSLWSLADAAAFPRKPFRVCELVSPLKPLEPMAMGIPVVVSDVAALRELVKDGELGLLHRAGDPVSLTEQLRVLATDPERRSRLARTARESVLRERTWQKTAERVIEVYRRLVQGLAVVPLAAGRSSMTAEEKLRFEEQLEHALASGGTAAVRELATLQAEGRSDKLLAFCWLKAATLCQRNGHAEDALTLARAAVVKDPGASTLRGVARVLYAAGDFAGAEASVSRLEQLSGGLSAKDEEFAREVRSRTRLLALLAEPAATASVAPTRGKSVYFLHFSLPYTSVGYATRSHGLIAGIRATGYDVRPYTRPGFPQDFKPELEGAQLPDADEVDGIVYRRLLAGSRRGSSESEYLLSSVDAYEAVLREERPELVHAASNYVTALPALIAARRLGLPFIYEIRGFWEITRSSRDNEFENSTRFALMRQFESMVACAADHVFTLTSAMKAELVARGVRAERISLVHNAVDPERFVPIPPHLDLAERLGLRPNVPVIGYVGSFVDYEGLDDLIRACGMLARRAVDFQLLLVGDGAVLKELRQLASLEQLGQRVYFTGRVPHDEVDGYYSLLDICPFPRKPWEVCEMVSPLKPFEAMAMNKVVVVSSTHALREIVDHERTGLVFEKGNVASLADCLERLVRDVDLRQNFEANARDWVLQQRTWRASGRVVVEGYQAVLGGAAKQERVTA